MTETVVASEHRYRGRILNLRLDTVRLPAGRIVVREVVEHAGAVAMVPMNERGEVFLVRQHRMGSGGPLLEIPAGTLEPGEDPAACAHRELQEEIGYAAARLDWLGAYYLAPGYSTELLHLYLARDLSEAVLEADFDENIEVERATLDDILQRFKAGEPTDMKTMTGLLLTRELLEEERKRG